MSAHAGLKSGKYSASGLPCAMLVRSGLKSVSALLIASTAVIVPPAASKFARNAAARPSAYGLSSLIVAAVVMPLLRVHEVGHDRALDLVVVRGAQVERLVRLLGRQSGVRVRRRDQQDALVGQDLVGHAERGARAARADDRHDRRVGGERRGACLATFGRAEVVLVGQFDGVADELAVQVPVEGPVQVVDGQRRAILAVLAERRRVTADREQRADGDRRSGRHLDAAEADRVAVDARHRWHLSHRCRHSESPSSLEQAAPISVSTPTSASSRRIRRCFMKPPFVPILGRSPSDAGWYHRTWAEANRPSVL